ncbi:MAG: lysophospholipid acyltransferase family protein [Bacteroidota bacterium]
MRYFCRLILKLAGWRCEGQLPRGNKYLIVSAPHTSMWDFVIGKLFYHGYGISSKVLIKKELFVFPVNILLRLMGGIPVDRKNRTNMIQKMVELFRDHDKFVLTITPEGTREKVRYWKRGFYYIAERAGVPLLPGYCDYSRKVIGIGQFIYPTGDIEKDMKLIKGFFRGIVPRHPDKFEV